jgi:hypothetical protein
MDVKDMTEQSAWSEAQADAMRLQKSVGGGMSPRAPESSKSGEFSAPEAAEIGKL